MNRSTPGLVLPLLIWGCTATPLPEAPLDAEVETNSGTMERTLRGGSIDPAQIVGVWLFEGGPPFDLAVGSGGTFTQLLPPSAVTLRLGVVAGHGRSVPLDLQIAETASPVPADPCLRIDRQIEVTLGVNQVFVENGCEAAVRVAPAVRPGATGFRVDATPLDVAAGGSGSIDVEVDTIPDDLLLLFVEGARTETRAVTLY